MVLDRLEQQGINIKDLTLSESRKDKPIFDPNTDITPQDWEKFAACLDDNPFDPAMNMASLLCALVPDRTSFMSNGRIQNLAKEILDDPEEQGQPVSSHNLSEALYYATTVKKNPDNMPSPKDLYEALDDHGLAGTPVSVPQHIRAALLDPQIIPYIKNDEKALETIKSNIKRNPNIARSTNDYVFLKLFFPEEFKLFEIPKDDLIKYKKMPIIGPNPAFDDEYYCELAEKMFNLSVLSAESARISERGLELTYPKPQDTEHKIPEGRKF